MAKRKTVTSRSAVGLLCAAVTILLFQNCGPSFQAAKLTLQDFDQVSNGNDFVGGELKLNCSASDVTAQVQPKRLTVTQIENSLRVIFGEGFRSEIVGKLDFLPFDTEIGKISSSLSPLSPQQMRSYMDFTLALAGKAYDQAAMREKIYGSCSTVTPVTDQCIESYLDQTGTLVLRKELSAEEKSAALAFFKSYSSDKDGFQYLLASQLMSPSFLLRVDLGESTSASGEVLLTQFELASRISFLLADAAPDVQLLEKAKSGTLRDPLVLRAEVERLVAESTLVKEKFKRYGYYWLGKNSPDPDLSRLPTALVDGLQTDGLLDAADAESEKFSEYVIWDLKGNVRDLLVSRASFANHAGLASIYGHAPVSGSAPATTADDRKGLLTRLPFLYDTRVRTPLIQRGVRLQTGVLCNHIPPPSDAVIDMRMDTHLSLEENLRTTNRGVIAHMTAGASCIGCHSMINPAGNIFERFDSFGRLRTTEKTFDVAGNIAQSLPVDASDRVQLWYGQSTSVSDHKEFIDRVADSKRVRSCFAKKIYEFTHTRTSTDSDACHIQKVYSRLGASDGSVLEAIVDSVANDGILKIKKD